MQSVKHTVGPGHALCLTTQPPDSRDSQPPSQALVLIMRSSPLDRPAPHHSMHTNRPTACPDSARAFVVLPISSRSLLLLHALSSIQTPGLTGKSTRLKSGSGAALCPTSIFPKNALTVPITGGRDFKGHQRPKQDLF